MPFFIGIDCGTSGLRGIAIDADGVIQAEAKRSLPASCESNSTVTQQPDDWREATLAVLAELPKAAALAIDGTSGTILLTNAAGEPVSAGRMYNCSGSAGHAARIAEIAPAESGAHGASSPLARLIDLQAEHPGAVHVMHQADWLAAWLTGRFGISDDNNALKLGWDPINQCWPDWLDELLIRRDWLPSIVAPGTPIGEATDGTLVVAGTTDGCASFLATGASKPGDAVTALGTTLTVKLMCDSPVFAPAMGVYSHKLGDRWLAGGASNSGGAAIARFFATDEIKRLSAEIVASESLPALGNTDWHPLPGKGERFPINDPDLVFEPNDHPTDRAEFLLALLDGVAGVEALAYRTLAEQGAPKLRSLRTVGSGSTNPLWTQRRERRLGVVNSPPISIEAAYGTALLARQGWLGHNVVA